MGKIKDIGGKKFNSWTVSDKSEARRINGRFSWKCTCDCGNIAYHISSNITTGKTKSCNNCATKRKKIFNGDSKPSSKYYKLYTTHSCMMARCYYEKDNSYYRYGEIGVSVCEEWKNYLDFKRWALDNGWKKGLVISRNNDKGNYSPKNTKWKTRFENTQEVNLNRKMKRKLTDKQILEILEIPSSKNGKTGMTRKEIAEKYGVSVHTIAGIRAKKLYKEITCHTNKN